jgi:hypothetical protein
VEASIFGRTEPEYHGKFFKKKARILEETAGGRKMMNASSAWLVSSWAAMKNNSPREKTPLEEDVSIHILSVSAAMVGVCLTVIGLIRIVITMGKFDTIADNILALASLIFLISCFCSYWALRTRGTRRMHRLERIADAAFLLGLLLMVIVCGIITFSMI